MDKIFGTYCASLTPVNKNYSINKELFLEHCKNILTQGLDGLGIFGTTGEANSFSVDEKIEAINFLTENGISTKNLIIGTGLCSIQDTVKLTSSSSKLKVKAVLVLPAFYYKKISNEGVINFYREIIEKVADSELKYILYHFPNLTGIPINFKILEELLKFYPKNIVGIKDSGGDINNMLKVIKYFNELSVFSGSDSLAVKACQHGGAGAITAVSNISGKLLNYLIHNYKDQQKIENFQELQILQEKIRELATTQEVISVLKAFISVEKNNLNWNRLVPPLKEISDTQNNKTVLGLIELVKKMKILLAHS